MILAADNIQPLNQRVAEAIARLDPEPIIEIARRAERAGAAFLDLNPGPLSKRQEDRMAFLVETVQEATSLGLILDSPNPRVLAAGLDVARRKPILSALTLEPAKLAEIAPLAAARETDLVALLLDERSMPPADLEGKLAAAVELRERAMAAGLAPERLIFDPVLPSLSWPDASAQAAAGVETVRLLASGALFQEPARTMAGLSNLRSGMRGRVPIRVEAVFLAMLAGAGLRYALVDVFQEELLADARVMARFGQGTAGAV